MEGDFDGDVAQVVLARAVDGEDSGGGGFWGGGCEHRNLAPQPFPRGAVYGERNSLGQYFAAAGTGAGAHIDEVVRGADDVPIVLHDDHRISDITEAGDGGDEAGGIGGVEADGRLVEDVDDAGEAGAELGGELDPLDFAAGEGGGGAIKGEIIETDVFEEGEAFMDIGGEIGDGGGVGLEGGDPGFCRGDMELAEFHDAEGGGLECQVARFARVWFVKGIGNPFSVLDFYVLEVDSEAEVAAGWAAEAFADGAGAFEGIEGEMTWCEIPENFPGAGIPVGCLEGELAVAGIAGVLEEDLGFRSADAEGELDGIREAGVDAIADDEAVDDDFDPVGGVGIDCETGDFLDFTIQADADESLALEIAEEAIGLGGFGFGNRGEDNEPGAFRLGGEFGNDFRGTHAGHDRAGIWIVGDSDGGPDDAEVIVNIGGGSYGGSRRQTADALLDGDRGIESLDGIDIGSFELGEELAGVNGEGFDVTALTFGVEGIEGEGGFPGAGRAGDDGEFSLGDCDRKVFEMMLAGTTDEDFVHLDRSLSAWAEICNRVLGGFG